MSKELSQDTRVFKLLQKAGKHGVENYTFAANRILRYGACLKRLRDDGHNIMTERVHLPNGRATGVYKYILIEEPKKNSWTKNIFKKDK